MSPEKRKRRLLPGTGAEEDPREMSFLEHLEELRWVLVRSGVAIMVASVIMWGFSTWIYSAFLLRPLGPIRESVPGLQIIFLQPAGIFLAKLNISLWAAAIVALPYVAWEIWRFVVPGLFKHERRLVPWVVLITVLCFLAGAALAYFVVLPYALNFFLATWQDLATPQLEVKQYLSFSMRMIFSFGLVFELPVLSFFLARFGILTADFLKKGRSWGYFLIAIFSAFITPPDPFTMLVLMGPLIILYEVSIWVTRLAQKKRRQALP